MAYIVTVSQFRKMLKGIDGKLPIYIADFDQGIYETSGSPSSVCVLDRNEAPDFELRRISENDIVKGKYCVIRNGS